MRVFITLKTKSWQQHTKIQKPLTRSVGHFLDENISWLMGDEGWFYSSKHLIICEFSHVPQCSTSSVTWPFHIVTQSEMQGVKSVHKEQTLSFWWDKVILVFVTCSRTLWLIWATSCSNMWLSQINCVELGEVFLFLNLRKQHFIAMMGNKLYISLFFKQVPSNFPGNAAIVL